MVDQSDYARKLLEQQQQYVSGADIHALPGIFNYWANRYILPQIQGAFGANTITEVYGEPIVPLLTRGTRRKIVSIGSGDCTEEIKLAKYLLEQSCSGFEIVGLEVAENLISEGKAAIDREGLTAHVTTEFFDVNRQTVEGPVAAYIAHHSLHHIEELERLFAMIDGTLAEDGHFITCDMIGRNGHMRWPETLRYVEAVWSTLPDEKKFNWQLKDTHHQFLNWDCSVQGFEGIRAQDILPLLLERFSFAAFAGCGGFIDPFVDRGYGPNYSEGNPLDRDFIDVLAMANDGLLNAGTIKPTMIFADMVKKNAAGDCKVVGCRTPEFCVRYPD